MRLYPEFLGLRRQRFAHRPGQGRRAEAMNNKGWVIIALVVAGLYWLKAVLIP